MMNKQSPIKPSKVAFYFDGKKYYGQSGDTLAAALLRSGVYIVGRSFKYHRPRGVFSAGVEEPNAIVQIGDKEIEQPNVQATRVEIYEGLVARSLNAWPSARFDLLSVMGLLSPLFISGFYYKVFKWPSWRFWSPVVRKMAGLGTMPKSADQNTYDKAYSHTDILIVGAGPAGIMACLAHASLGARVTMVEQNSQLGGSLLFEGEVINDQPAILWLADAVRQLSAMDNVTIIKNATATGYYDHNLITVSEDVGRSSSDQKQPNERFHHIRAGKVIIASGAIERPLVFPNNDRPRVMLASAIRQYLNQFGVVVGKRVLIATNNDTAYQTALDMHNAGVQVEGVVDARKNPNGALAKAARAAGITIFAGHVVINVHGRRGVKAATITAIDSKNMTLNNMSQTITCDCLGVSGGWSPVVHLHSQSGGKLKFDNKSQSFIPSGYVQENICIGAANGTFDLGDCLREGADDTGFDIPKTSSQKHGPILALWDLPKNLSKIKHAKRWVDLLHDVTANDVALAARENYTSIEHFKRYTTTGMALDQGKTSNVNAIAILATETERKISEVGTTKFRPPYTAVTMGAMSARSTGALFRPLSLLPCHKWHTENGALMEDYGGWQRPVCYAHVDETEENAISREVLAVRSHVGILDYSPLGKIDIQGADAAQFLNNFYVNNVESLKVGRTRYGLMLNEHGSIIDDGVFARVADDHFMVTTTSGGARSRSLWFEEWRQCEWPEMDVVINPITNGWGTISLQGPNARKLLSLLDTDINLSKEAFPHMAIRLGNIEGVPTRILRASFTGELGFEINVPRSYVDALWRRIIDIGGQFDLTPFGVEALMILRTEKGYIHVGVETDSSSIPDDVGFGMVARNKAKDYIGKRSLYREDAIKADREALVGLKSVNGEVLPMGGIIMAKGFANAPAPMDGRVTSSYQSPSLGVPVALGLIKGGNKRLGEIVKIYDANGISEAKVVPSCFYDKDGEKLNV